MAAVMNCFRLEFAGPGRVDIKPLSVKEPGENEVLVKTCMSAVSPGTEMLVYRGQWPAGVATDSTIPALSGQFSYPLSYGYCTVGRVVETGISVAEDWYNRRVFAFQPHQSLFLASPQELVAIPDDIDDETALFLANMETAVNLLLDGRPLIGEQVVVLGQGIIGLLTTALLLQFPLATLTTLDRYSLRRKAARDMGVAYCYDPAEPGLLEQLGATEGQGGKADLLFELSGNPAALNTALALSRFSGRVVIGSWYGAKKSQLDLGSFFHRGRVSLMSSQVSRLDPGLTGRWQKSRRLQFAWEMLRRTDPAVFITQRFDLADACSAYSLIDQHPEETIQVIFEYT